MIHSAFILSRVSDIDIASACSRRLLRQGWTPWILVDPREWRHGIPFDTLPCEYSTMGKGMFGNQCAESIVQGILDYSNPGDRVAKFDCDIRLTEDASDWFMVGESKAFTQNGGVWGGCWSSSREALEEAFDRLKSKDRCRCPESSLIARSLEIVPATGKVAIEWNIGHKWPDVPCVTLPRTCKPHRRAESGAALFAQN